jgi:hypothetical protein
MTAMLQWLQDFQKSDEKASAKMEQAKKLELHKLNQQHNLALKRRDQQIKALYDAKVALQSQFDNASESLRQITSRYQTASGAMPIAAWVQAIEDNALDVVRMTI